MKNLQTHLQTGYHQKKLLPTQTSFTPCVTKNPPPKHVLKNVYTHHHESNKNMYPKEKNAKIFQMQKKNGEYRMVEPVKKLESNLSVLTPTLANRNKKCLRSFCAWSMLITSYSVRSFFHWTSAPVINREIQGAIE